MAKTWAGLCLLLLCTFPACISSSKYIDSIEDLEGLYQAMSEQYELSANLCPFDSLDKMFRRSDNSPRYANVLANTPCLNRKSIGYSLTNYMEARICVNITNLHYISLKKDIRSDSALDPFFSLLPNIIYNQYAPKTHQKAKFQCLCHSLSCHESKAGLIHSHWRVGKDILNPLVRNQASAMARRSRGMDKSLPWMWWAHDSLDSAKALPHVPSVAVHYRCNSYAHAYGFLNYDSIHRRIPKNASTVYVMSEENEGKGKMSERQRIVCTAVLEGLYNYITSFNPEASVVMLRGANVYDDFTRLATARVLICSVSIFCFWTAVAASHDTTVYLPRSELIAGGSTPIYDSNVHWMTEKDDYAVQGKVTARFWRNPSALVEMLSGRSELI